MAERRAKVVQSFEPVGDLQLHRLDKPIRFHCVTCLQDKKANLIATTNGDWKQVVCEECYEGLVYLQQEQAKKAANKAKQRQVSRNKYTNQANQSTSRLPGARGLLAFFRAAGFDAELGRDGWLRIGGKQIYSLYRLPGPETLEWKKTVDKIVVKRLRDKFNKAVGDNARFADGVRIVSQWNGFAIMRDNVELGFIYPTGTYISDGKIIYANFLTSGPHWQQVADDLGRAELALATGRRYKQEAPASDAGESKADAGPRRADAPRRIDQLPGNLAPELIDACLDASRRIRLERQVAYERPVVLECDIGELTLLPITGAGTRLLLPFHLSKGMKTLKGELVLGDRDPLPLLIDDDVADRDAITAWTYALVGFADATCVEFEPVEPTIQHEPARLRQPSSSGSRHRPSTRTLPRQWRWPRHLEPVGHWIGYHGSFVAGHRRRLNDGRTASAEAHGRAQQVGITLHQDETWVRPHTRGVPEGIEMRFQWHAPTQFKLSQTQPTGSDHQI
jgi:hypothetical protein